MLNGSICGLFHHIPTYIIALLCTPRNVTALPLFLIAQQLAMFEYDMTDQLTDWWFVARTNLLEAETRCAVGLNHPAL